MGWIRFAFALLIIYTIFYMSETVYGENIPVWGCIVIGLTARSWVEPGREVE